MFTLGYPFRPVDASQSRSPTAPRSCSYIARHRARGTASTAHIRFGHRVVVAPTGRRHDARWTRHRRARRHGDACELTCGFLFACTGYYRYDRGYAARFPGMRATSAGKLVHPQHWPADLDYAGQRVVVIGSGATAVTLVPALAGDAAHVTMLQRSPSYVALAADARPARRLAAPACCPAAGPARAGPLEEHALVTQASTSSAAARPTSPSASSQGARRAAARRATTSTPTSHPRYDPWDQRLCVVPDGDLSGPSRAGRASVVTDRHRHRSPSTASGSRPATELPADVVVSATGL